MARLGFLSWARVGVGMLNKTAPFFALDKRNANRLGKRVSCCKDYTFSGSARMKREPRENRGRARRCIRGRTLHDVTDQKVGKAQQVG